MQRLGWGARRTAAVLGRSAPLAAFRAPQSVAKGAIHISTPDHRQVDRRKDRSDLNQPEVQPFSTDEANSAYPDERQGSSFDRDADLTERLFAFLNSSTASTAHRLPHHYTRLDAYLHLKEHDPYLLSQLSDDSLNRLCSSAGMQGLGSVLISILDDLEGVTSDNEDDVFFNKRSFEGTEMESLHKLRQTSSTNSGGIFAAAPGTKRRIFAIQNMIMGASHRKASMQAGAAGGEEGLAEEEPDAFLNVRRVNERFSLVELQRAFKMLLGDIASFKKITNTQASGQSSSDALLPSTLIDKTARRLIRTITLGGIYSSDHLLAQLIQHVMEHDEWPFPTLAEGWQLLDYFMGMDSSTSVSNLELYTSEEPSSSNDEVMPQPLAAARGVINKMAYAFPEVVSDHVLRQVGREGQKYREYLLSNGCTEEVAADISVRHSLRSVIVHTVLKPGKEEVLQRQIQLLVDEVKLTASSQNVEPPLWILAPIVRAGISLRLSAQVHAEKALPMALRFSNVWMQDSDGEESGRVLQSLCHWAIDQDKPQLATDLILNILKGQPTGVSGIRPEARIVGGATIVRLLENARSNSRGDVVAVLMEQLGIIDGKGTIGDDTIDQIFSEPYRAKVIVLLARSGLKRQCRTLYERWGAPFDGSISAQDVQAHLKEMLVPLRKNSLSANEQNRLVTSDLAASVKGSPNCLYHLVRLLCGTRLNDESLIDNTSLPVTEEGEDEYTLGYHTRFAYHVLFQFFTIQPYSRALDRATFVTLAKTYLRLGHRQVAFKCLSDTVVAHPTAELQEATTLFRLMGLIDIEEASDFIIKAIGSWKKRHEGAEEELAGMISVLIETAFQQHRFDMAHRLFESAVSNELHHYADIVSMGTLVKFALADQPSRNEILKSHRHLTSEEMLKSSQGSTEKVFFVRWIQERMEKYDWKPDPKFLTWMINVVIRKGGLSDPPANATGETMPGSEDKSIVEREAGLNAPIQYSLNELERKGGITLLSLCARKLSYLDLEAASSVIRSTQNAAYHLRQSKRRDDKGIIGQLAKELDQVTALLRWTPNINSRGIALPKERIGKLPATTAPGVPMARPNRLPPRIFRVLVTTYLRIGDMIGAASVVAWARDDARYSLEELGKGWKNLNGRSFKNSIKDVIFSSDRAQGSAKRGTVMNWFAGAQPVPKTKFWWERPEGDEI